MDSTINEDLNLGVEPFLPQVNKVLDASPRLSRAIRLITWMALTEGSDRCRGIAEHTPCAARMFQRMTTLVLLAIKSPDAIDCLLEATRPAMRNTFPMIDWEYVESDDEGRV